MKNKDIQQLFNNLKPKLDSKEPALGHLKRFEAKLLKQKKTQKTKSVLWKYFAVAASFALLIIFEMRQNKPVNGLELATVSEKMAETQDYFTLAIKERIENIDKEKNKDTQKIIDDALLELQKIEQNYQQLKIDLQENSNENNIIYAMIENFQQRIIVLENVLKQIKNIKKLKKQYNETVL